MKKTIFLSMTLMLFFTSLAFAAKEVPLPTEEELDYLKLASSLSGPREPYMSGDFVVFTADKNARHVGIAFDFENFEVIHSFKLKNLYDQDFEVADSFYFYILSLPKTVQKIQYRIVVDGLWTTDPLNPRKVYNRDTEMMLSELLAKRDIPPVTEKHEDDGLVHFIYEGKSGQEIRLGGSFTHWDSWIYRLKEVAPGLYALALPLAPGTYQYAYYTGTTSFIDVTNPERCYTPEGKMASQIVVK